MSESSAILKSIHDQFDVYPCYPYSDHSVISNANFESNERGYRVTTYPGGYGSLYDGFVINAEVPNGIFGDSTPSRIETSRDTGGAMIFSPISEEPEVDPISGEVTVAGRIHAFPKVEGLLLPGDEGFELFIELHRRLQAILPTLRHAMEPLIPSAYFRKAKITNRGGNQSFDHENEIITHHRSTTVEARGDEPDSVQVTLDSTVKTGFGDPGDPGEFVYSFGEAEIHTKGEKSISVLDDLTLANFNDLHAEIAELYRD